MKTNRKDQLTTTLFNCLVVLIIEAFGGNLFARQVLPVKTVHATKTTLYYETHTNHRDSVFTKVEQMPVFPGGDQALMNYLSKNIKYPKKERKKNIQGKVLVSFVINPEGKIKDVHILKGVPDALALENEAMRVVKEMPQWQPGYQSGKPVSVSYVLPISFVLK